MIEPYTFPRPVKPITPSEAASRKPTPRQQEAIDATVNKINDALIGVRPGESYTIDMDYYSDSATPSGMRDAVLDVFRGTGWIIAPYRGERCVEIKSPLPDVVAESVKPKTRGREVAERQVGLNPFRTRLRLGKADDGLEVHFVLDTAPGLDSAIDGAKEWLAGLIDSERAAAAKESREAWTRAWNAVSKFAAPGSPEALKTCLTFEHNLAAGEERKACLNIVHERLGASYRSTSMHPSVAIRDIERLIEKRGEAKS